jgi:serine/threonine protein kinase
MQIMLQIVRGMKSLHQCWILHMDLKASNVLLQQHSGYESSTEDVFDFMFVIADFETSVGVSRTRLWRVPEVTLCALRNRYFDLKYGQKRLTSIAMQ